ncbi:MAG: wax ester/triacylglycerol synthase family O-acyltransferase [Rhodoferax sp.]|nr:wax ester/triacylglycerol synthase family O-acyltransferase [Rhodoferax sp.]
MSKLDAAWLHMDSETSLMMMVGVLVLRPGLRYADLATRLQQRLPYYPRFVQCAREGASDASGAHRVDWVTDPDFHIANHLVLEKLPGSSAASQQQALQDRLGSLCMQPLDRQHPLWQFHLVEHYQGGSAVVLRIHHCMAEGMALMAFTQAMVDGTPPPTARPGEVPGPNPMEDWLLQALLQPLTHLAVHSLETAGDAASKALALAGEGAMQSLFLLLHPQEGVNKGVKKALKKGMDGTAELAHAACQILSDLAALAQMPDDSVTRLKGQPGRHKRVAWCAPLPLADIQEVGRALNCSVNDVLLSCVAGAIGEYLRCQGEDLTDMNIPAMVPVNVRPQEQARQPGKQLGLVPLLLPIGLRNPVERVYAVRSRMRVFKGSMETVLTYTLLGAAGLLIQPVQDTVLELFASKFTAILTNVPGPASRPTLCGSTMEECLFWVPQTGSVGLGLSILSYGGAVQFGLMADASLCPRPQQIVDQFEPEFAKLTMLTLMLPWGEGEDEVAGVGAGRGVGLTAESSRCL